MELPGCIASPKVTLTMGHMLAVDLSGTMLGSLMAVERA
jgi:hypothetical protein